MTNTNSKKPNKYLLLVTYLIAVVCLLLGLFLPFWGDKEILALQLPAALNATANRTLISVGNDLALKYPISLFGTSVRTDMMGVFALLYTVVTLFSLVLLIPVGISTKKGTPTASVLMRIAETAAVLVTSLYVVIALQQQCTSIDLGEGLKYFSYGIAVAYLGNLLALAIQNIACKKVRGIVNTIVVILALIAVVALYNLTKFISALGNLPLAPVLVGMAEEIGADGISFVTALFDGSLFNSLSVLPDVKNKALYCIIAAVALIVIVNYIIDVIFYSTNTKKVGRIFNIARYVLQLVVAICLIITVLICKYKIGIMLIVIAAIAVVQALINLPYLIKELKKSENGEPAEPATQEEGANAIGTEELTTVQELQPVAEPVLMESNEQYDQPQPQPIPVDEDGWDEPLSMEALQDVEPTIEPDVAPVPRQSSAPERSSYNTYSPEVKTQVYTINTIYGGPVDDFMRKLTNDEKIEFAMTFIEKSKGNIGNIPDYVIGGNNRLFFSCVFIYLGRIRGLISDGLLNKMYKELNLL